MLAVEEKLILPLCALVCAHITLYYLDKYLSHFDVPKEPIFWTIDEKVQLHD